MKRDIKFRGKRVDNGEWVYGDLIHYNEQFFINVYDTEFGYYAYQVEIIAETVGQFTGLKDKNGVEIYEGDIIVGYGTHNLIVFIDKGHTKIKWNDLGSNLTNLLFQDWIIEEDVEVVGNIYENKELLK